MCRLLTGTRVCTWSKNSPSDFEATELMRETCLVAFNHITLALGYKPSQYGIVSMTTYTVLIKKLTLRFERCK